MPLGSFSRNGGRLHRGAVAIAALSVLCVNLVSACASTTATPTPAASTPAASTPAASTPAASVSGTQAPDLHGKVITIAAPYTGSEADKYLKALKPFEDKTGIVIKYTGTRDLGVYLAVAVEAGTPPDIGMTPTPGSIQGWAKKIPPLPADIVAEAKANLDKGWIDLGSDSAGNLLGVPNIAEMKSLVWYSNKYFKQYGYTIPKTWDELTALEDRMVKEGHTPWCVGVESSAATGWVFTDWLEDFVLRMYGADVFDQWVRHQIPFTDSRIKAATKAVTDLLFKPGYVLQSRAQIVSTSYVDAGLPILDGKCMMHKQANFYDIFFKNAGATSGPDGDVNAFYLPPMGDKFGTPTLISGNYAIAFTSKPETVEFMRYLASAEYWNIAIKTNGILSPWKTTDLSQESVAINRVFDAMLAANGPARFDASDAMPSAVGGAFMREATAYLSGTATLDQMLANIEKAWSA
jgi:alpha-glucoside transport system substrate-binding protein